MQYVDKTDNKTFSKLRSKIMSLKTYLNPDARGQEYSYPDIASKLDEILQLLRQFENGVVPASEYTKQVRKSVNGSKANLEGDSDMPGNKWWKKIRNQANKIVEKEGELDQSDAISKVMKTDAGRRWYKKYRKAKREETKTPSARERIEQ